MLCMQLASKAELLQNELDVVGSEGTEDRLSGAARLLDLNQQCEELKARLEVADEAKQLVSNLLPESLSCLSIAEVPLRAQRSKMAEGHSRQV